MYKTKILDMTPLDEEDTFFYMKEVIKTLIYKGVITKDCEYNKEIDEILLNAIKLDINKFLETPLF